MDEDQIAQHGEHAFKDPGKYVGPLTKNGLRKGVGICTWTDKSKYEGEWLNNVRHGNGKFKNHEYEYLG